ncbi:hypothetical protein F0Q53_03645 [Anaplasma marginale]|uniref:Uncharacterized protein n=1 Tax=Anaplasma marginale TaxID=770 RepID=A0A643CKT1_ANAMA|nr:hypothetical protein BKM88_01365 [Anaplasma marginale]KAA8473197.1 hypothetical protein F0Q58_00160 [Anaplasma marginale]KAA8473905.1 hypothetical protein F0Q53_03645 [Anaplasma marginale]KAB0451561.1 hypothetical protein FY210_00160 [Anaplasma marginale]KAB0451587.1 hypothetical protein FY207_03825 [Anaplasma marginale]
MMPHMVRFERVNAKVADAQTLCRRNQRCAPVSSLFSQIRKAVFCTVSAQLQRVLYALCSFCI